MAAQCRLDSLNGSVLAFGNFVQLIGVLLFLLKQLLIHLAGLLGLADHLLNKLFALVDLIRNIRVQLISS
ncbi:hypothetical protein D3C81_440600 [compost metagenome]